MEFNPDNPLIVQSDRSLLLEAKNPLFEEARIAISPFAELVKSPELIHTYRITPISLWNAASAGFSADRIYTTLRRYAKYGVPDAVWTELRAYLERYGALRIERDGERLFLTSEDPSLLAKLAKLNDLRAYWGAERTKHKVAIASDARGILKRELIRLGYPVQDLAGYSSGTRLSVSCSARLRDYQREAVEAFYAGGSVHGGNGVVVLPCGAGKTIVGIAAMARIGMETLVLTNNVTSVRQWIREILDKTNLSEEQVGEYSGDQKEVKPVTVTTYQMLTHRGGKDHSRSRVNLFNKRDWGFIVYDEVHMLPAPIFRLAATLQAKRRLGLTATLVREDGRAEDVFSLVGPKKYDMPWKRLEDQGWIAKAECVEIRVAMPDETGEHYARVSTRSKSRVAAENPMKEIVVRQLLDHHANDKVLIIGQYIEQLERLSRALDAPVITGKTPQKERDRLYQQFLDGRTTRLIVSKVANFAIDLPDANVAIQISGTFGSRQEEAQRLGRVLRPKKGENRAFFYTLVSRGTKEEEWALKRQLFLVEQGYRYHVLESVDGAVDPPAPRA